MPSQAAMQKFGEIRLLKMEKKEENIDARILPCMKTHRWLINTDIKGLTCVWVIWPDMPKEKLKSEHLPENKA